MLPLPKRLISSLAEKWAPDRQESILRSLPGLRKRSRRSGQLRMQRVRWIHLAALAKDLAARASLDAEIGIIRRGGE